jgi:hypothetical protein
MAEAKIDIVQALRSTARNLQKGSAYMWGHMGSCNCGNLAQEITKLSKSQIHNYALQGKGDWSEQLNDYCDTSAMPMDLLIFELLSFGFSVQDLKNLEYLSDEEILLRLPKEKRHLRRNVRYDVVVYLNEWANMLGERILFDVKLPDFLPEKQQINVKTT